MNVSVHAFVHVSRASVQLTVGTTNASSAEVLLVRSIDCNLIQQTVLYQVF